jgi:hypothetical protein
MNDQPKKKRRRRKKGLGLTRKAFAEAIDTPPSAVDAMIAAGEVKVIMLGSLERIPHSEVEKFRALFGEAAE